MLRKLWLLLIFVLLVPLMAQDTEPIRESVLDIPGMTDVLDVSFSEEDDLTTLNIVYLTREIGEVGYRAELLDVFRAVGAALDEAEITVDRVLIVPSVEEDSAVEYAGAQIDALRDLMNGDITRTTFLDGLEILPGEHQAMEDGGEA